MAQAAVVALVLALVSGCGIPLEHINDLRLAQKTGKAVRAEYPRLTKDVPYVDNAADLQKLDIYRPDTEGLAPVLVFVHGGYWQYGHRSEYAALGKTFTDEGFVTVLPDYRLYPDVHHPDWITDTVAALNWVMKNIDQYGGDPARIVVAGHSAGSQILALIATDDEFRDQLEFPIERLAGIALLSGPFDYDAGAKRDIKAVHKIMGSDELYESTQPEKYIRPDLPPTLILNGGEDNLTPETQARAYAEKLLAAGAPVRYEVLPGGDHYTMVLDMLPGRNGPSMILFRQFLREKTMRTTTSPGIRRVSPFATRG
ncbi:alpha/beta hydrolase [bacterium]|nr:alpha/beta hydrolase [bacterium]